jgi:hypothetical protein
MEQSSIIYLPFADLSLVGIHSLLLTMNEHIMEQSSIIYLPFADLSLVGIHSLLLTMNAIHALSLSLNFFLTYNIPVQHF